MTRDEILSGHGITTQEPRVRVAKDPNGRGCVKIDGPGHPVIRFYPKRAAELSAELHSVDPKLASDILAAAQKALKIKEEGLAEGEGGRRPFSFKKIQMEKRRVRHQSEKHIYIHNELSSASWYFKGIIENKVKDGIRDAITFDCMACLTLLAFTFEAYINFLGDRLIAEWKERERFDDKVAKVLGHLELTPNENTRPYSSIKQLKTLRDTLAHGKPVRKEVDEIVAGDAEELRRIDLSGDWEKDCNPDAAIQAYDDVEKIWRELLEKAGIPIFDTLPHGEGSITVIETDPKT